MIHLKRLAAGTLFLCVIVALVAAAEMLGLVNLLYFLCTLFFIVVLAYVLGGLIEVFFEKEKKVEEL